MNSHGVGADQIVGAKVVNAKGNLVEADAGLLKGLRGGGGSLAIVAELVIKIYPLEKLQAGLIVHESSDLHKTVTTFYTNFAKLLDEMGGRLPSQLQTIRTISPLPGIGIISGCIVAWKGPADEKFQHWRDRIANLAPLHPALSDAATIVANTVRPTSPSHNYFTPVSHRTMPHSDCKDLDSGLHQESSRSGCQDDL